MTHPPGLRVLGRGEFLLDPIRERVQRDLGMSIAFDLVDGIESLQRAVTRPDSFDVYHQWHTVDLIWTARTIQPIDLARIEAANALRQVATAQAAQSARAAVFDRLFLQPDGTLGSRPSSHVALLPAIHGVDAFGYVGSVRDRLDDEPDSWAWLLDPRWHGQVAIMSDPCQGMIEAALALEAAEGIAFEDIGNLSIEEIDLVADALLQLKKRGHFRGVWSNYGEAARLMQRGGVKLQSIWAPTLAQLRAEGLDVCCAVPLEGYRGWHSDLCISALATGEVLDAAYAYLNWWMSGWAGAVLSRQGYYMALPERARRHLAPEEWAYWYEGQPAARPLPDPFGRNAVRAGARREGGSYRERMAGARVWNSFMDEHTYLVRRWNEFLAG